MSPLSNFVIVKSLATIVKLSVISLVVISEVQSKTMIHEIMI